jgi:Protein of unknown function (DUF2971)
VTNEAQTSVITPEQFELEKRLRSIFMPHATRQIQKVYPDQTQARFVHYTSAESALNIIKSKRIWMRNTNCMSDFREVQHGFNIFNTFFSNSYKRKAFVEAMDSFAPGTAEEAITLFNQRWGDIQFNTYITAISEHDKAEDRHGRLSMWRAFGGNTARVGIVLTIPWFSQGSLALNLFFSPVAYLNEELAHKVLDEMVENVRLNRDFLHTVDRSIIVQTVFVMLLVGVVCLKHEGFHEEREWRAIYAPKSRPSSLMESSTEVIGGIPQTVYRIPLDAVFSEVLTDLDISRMFDRLIVGPTQYPWPMYEAFTAALTTAGVADADKRVFISEIPIRT